MLLSYKDKFPKIHPTSYISSNAVVTGDVTIDEDSSIWFHAVIRGDVEPTIIGKRVNIQDQCCLHQSSPNPLIIEDDVSVGHQVMLHSCTLRKNSLIGMGSIILDGAEIGEGSFIGAGSLVPPGKIIPSGVLAFGRPAKVIRELNEEDRKNMKRIVETYLEKGKIYKLEETKS